MIYPLEAASRLVRGLGGENQKIENRRAFSITEGEDGVLSFSLVQLPVIELFLLKVFPIWPFSLV